MLRGAVQQLQGVRDKQDGEHPTCTNGPVLRSPVTLNFTDVPSSAGGRTTDASREHRGQRRRQGGLQGVQEAEGAAGRGGLAAQTAWFGAVLG